MVKMLVEATVAYVSETIIHITYPPFCRCMPCTPPCVNIIGLLFSLLRLAVAKSPYRREEHGSTYSASELHSSDEMSSR